jgi:hypothetical protein
MRKLIAAAVLVWVGCGAESLAVEDYPAEVLDAVCRHLVRCGSVEDVERCRTANLGIDYGYSASEQAALDAGKIVFNGDKARTCLDDHAASSCDVTSQDSREQDPACLEVLTGTLREGEACALNTECVSRLCDVQACDTACCLGTCVGDVAPSVAKVGESCAAGTCEPAAFCDQDITTCVARKRLGASCTSINECAFGLDCDAGACAALPAPGEACAGACRDEGTRCSPITDTCVEVGLVGDPCTMASDCSVLYRCDETNHCSAGVAPGAACTATTRCAGNRAFCDVAPDASEGSCALPRADGEACRQDEQCEHQTCDPTTLRCVPEPICI